VGFQVSAEREKCKGCEECVEVSTVKVFEIQEGKAVPINVKDCMGCGSCVEVCKEKAITVLPVPATQSDGLWLLGGRIFSLKRF
jgi:NAD-dependent dihydropyrimidine dehydrogenase PreA subunit